MSIWFSRDLGDPLLVGNELDRIEALFVSEYDSAGQPPDMGVFVRHESDGGLHCKLRVYFTPATTRVARAVDAMPCHRPSPADLSLLAGSEACWSIFFSDQDR